MSGDWSLLTRRGSAGELHGARREDLAGRLVELLEVSRPALVLGSTQDPGVVNGPALADAGIDVVVRRSGGGAVLVVPGECLWVDVSIPPRDELWNDDVAKAFHWLGEAWVAALAGIGLVAEVHRGPLDSDRWARLVCFGGLGPGEVTIGGRKAVGMSQRRDRSGARFQCMVHRHWEPQRVAGLLALDHEDRVAAVERLEDTATAVDAPAEEILDGLLANLP